MLEDVCTCLCLYVYVIECVNVYICVRDQYLNCVLCSHTYVVYAYEVNTSIAMYLIYDLCFIRKGSIRRLCIITFTLILDVMCA